VKPVEFVISQTDASLTTHSGLALVGQMLRRSQLAERLDAIPLEGRPQPQISHGEVATAMIGLLCLGKPDFDAVEAFCDDPFFGYALGLETVPSARHGASGSISCGMCRMAWCERSRRTWWRAMRRY